MEIPKSHPRYESLKQREKIVKGLEKGYVAREGLIAHGRGEAFDYLLDEKTIPKAKEAEKVAVALLLLAKNPVISVNGNVAALVPEEIVELSNLLEAGIEINLFYRTKKRVKLIEEILREAGAQEVLGTKKENLKNIPHLESKRGRADSGGIFKADVVLVSVEDGDRTEALQKMEKEVIAIDLNPLSRTAQKATLTIVDNVTRALPNLIKFSQKLKNENKEVWKKLVEDFNNEDNLQETIKKIRGAI